MSNATTQTAHQRAPLSVTLGRYSALLLWAAFVILFGLLTPRTFWSSTTWQLTFSEGAVTAMLALAFLIPLAAGVYDLAVGTMLGQSLVIMNWFGSHHPGVPLWLVAIGAILMCGLIGLVSGLFVVRFRVMSLIATLGMSQVLLAFQQRISNNRQMTGAFGTKMMRRFGLAKVAGVPIVIIYLLVLALLLWYVLEHTPIGRKLFAVGGNPEAARLAGLNVKKITYGVLAASGLLAGLAGVVFSVKVGTYASSNGPGMLFPALAAVFFGASQFNRRPNVWGTLVAYFALAFGVKGLQLKWGPSTYWIQTLFQGASLLIAVSLASREITRTRASKRAQLAAGAADGAGSAGGVSSAAPGPTGG